VPVPHSVRVQVHLFGAASGPPRDRPALGSDGPQLVANAGPRQLGTWAQHLGSREVVEERLGLGDAPVRSNVGRREMALIHSMRAGRDGIDDPEAPQSRGTQGVPAMLFWRPPLGRLRAQLHPGSNSTAGPSGARAAEASLGIGPGPGRQRHEQDRADPRAQPCVQTAGTWLAPEPVRASGPSLRAPGAQGQRHALAHDRFAVLQLSLPSVSADRAHGEEGCPRVNRGAKDG
jgi:hypothetical protein